MSSFDETLTECPPVYGPLLNLMWAPQGLDYHLRELSREAETLARDRQRWSDFIRADNWRFPLVGCGCLLQRSNRDFFPDLEYRLARGSMVTPQIVVTLGLLHPVEATILLTAIIATPDSTRDLTRWASIQTALRKLHVVPTPGPELGAKDWSVIDFDRVELGNRTTIAWWNFWAPRIAKG